MLNVFPIQFLAPLAYTLLRIVLGGILFQLGFQHIRHREGLKSVFTFPFFPYGGFMVWYLAIIELLLGVLFFAGFLTQIAALLAVLLSLKFIVMHKKFHHPLIPTRLTYALILTISCALFITGAGALAIDLPI